MINAVLLAALVSASLLCGTESTAFDDFKASMAKKVEKSRKMEEEKKKQREKAALK